MAIENSITFGGVNSADFGIYISGEGVFNAPQRDVEMIEIPGRNGEFALDNGRFKNIEVSYPAFNFEPDDYDSFVQNLSDFRNAICSLRGYQRLTDTFHPDEYREAVYIGGLEIKPVKYNTASEFTIVFDCKPQRWLTSGENAVTVTSGDTLTNPTLFESSPLLEIEGVGDIEFNGYTVSIESTDIGEISLPCTISGQTYTLDGVNQLNTGDSITVSGFKLFPRRKYRTGGGNTQASVQSCTGLDGTQLSVSVWQTGVSDNIRNRYDFPDIILNYGTPRTIDVVGRVLASFGSTNLTIGETISIIYDGVDTLTYSYQNDDPAGPPTPTETTIGRTDPTVTAYSTKPYDYGTIYCDTDIGEFYRIEGGEYISMNHVGDLGSDLPTLAPGTNTVTYDNTITELNIAPRWWKI